MMPARQIWRPWKDMELMKMLDGSWGIEKFPNFFVKIFGKSKKILYLCSEK